MGIVTEQLYIIKNGEQIDLPLTDDKEQALATDSGDGTCLKVYVNNRILYASTNDKKSVPDEAPLAVIDGKGNIRYIHTHFGTLQPVLYATYTRNFSITSLDFPYGGYILARASNGSRGVSGGSGGASGYGWTVNVNGVNHIVPSGGGGGGGGIGTNPSGTRPAGATNVISASDGSGGSGGQGSTVTIEIDEGVHSLSGTVGRNDGSDRSGNNGGKGGNSYPSSSSSATLHRGSSGRSGRAGSWRYSGRTYSGSSGLGGRGGYGYELEDNVSQSTYSVQVYRYLYVV